MRRMSFSLTEEQYVAGTKTVTRRMGWLHLKPDENFMGIQKGMGLKKGEKQVVLGPSVCVSNRRERLNTVTKADVVREGFPDMTPAEFIDFYCKANRCRYDDLVSRIEFRRIP